MTDHERARLLAERFIDYQPRTSIEVRRRLARAGFEEEVVEAVVAELHGAGLLDDAQFSAGWVESRARSKGIGPVRLSAELRRKGIGREETDDAVGALDEETQLAAALELARKRWDPDETYDPAALRRLAGYLQRRGYGWSIIEQVFAQLGANSA